MLSGKQKRALAATLVSSVYLLLSIAIVEQILQAERTKQMNLARSNVNLQLMTAKGALESAVVLDAYVGNSVATLATVAAMAVAFALPLAPLAPRRQWAPAATPRALR